MSLNEKIIYAPVIIAIIIASTLTIIGVFTKQEFEYDKNINCERLKEELLLNLEPIVKKTVYNDLWGIKWNIETTEDGRKYYKEYCIGGAKGK